MRTNSIPKIRQRDLLRHDRLRTSHYLHDILIESATLEEHYNIVLRRIAEKGLELKLRHAGVTNLIHRVHPKKLSSAT